MKTVDGTKLTKRPKTGGRVKKPLDQLLAEARLRDDTVLPEELAAIYLDPSLRCPSRLESGSAFHASRVDPSPFVHRRRLVWGIGHGERQRSRLLSGHPQRPNFRRGEAASVTLGVPGDPNPVTDGNAPSSVGILANQY